MLSRLGGGAPGSMYRILLNADGNGDGGGTKTDPPADDKGPDLAKAVEGLLKKHGDPTAALMVLVGENYGYRDKLRTASERVPDGAVVLTGDDAKHWSKYRAFGSPSDIEKGLSEGSEAKTQAQGLLREKHLADVESVTGFKAKVLGTLAKDEVIEIRDVKGKDGQPVKDREGRVQKEAVVKGDGDKATPLADYAAERWPEFLPALKAEASKPALGTPTRPGAPPRPAPQGGGQAERSPIKVPRF